MRHRVTRAARLSGRRAPPPHPHHDGLRLQLGGYPVDPYGETDMLTASARQAARVSG